MKSIAALLLLLLSACNAIPRDADGTLPRIRNEHIFRVGIVEGPETGKFAGEIAKFLALVGQASGARAVVTRGASEPLFLDLKAKRLDLVVAALSPESPWADEVAILPPLAEDVGGKHLLTNPVARNGENAWIMLLEQQTWQVSGVR